MKPSRSPPHCREYYVSYGTGHQVASKSNFNERETRSSFALNIFLSGDQLLFLPVTSRVLQGYLDPSNSLLVQKRRGGRTCLMSTCENTCLLPTIGNRTRILLHTYFYFSCASEPPLRHNKRPAARPPAWRRSRAGFRRNLGGASSNTSPPLRQT